MHTNRRVLSPLVDDPDYDYVHSLTLPFRYLLVGGLAVANVLVLPAEFAVWATAVAATSRVEYPRFPVRLPVIFAVHQPASRSRRDSVGHSSGSSTALIIRAKARCMSLSEWSNFHSSLSEELL